VARAQSSVQGGTSVAATLYLNASAPMANAVVQLSSDHPSIVIVPASVTVPAGLSAVNFTVNTNSVSASTNVNITSSYAGATSVTTLTVTPP
ncbi:MAG: hypothetical protein JO097_12290, partial [Acidobacteriaceae bacterium]|nr:hypothetical protein [Acidobacteriaceae bacterium]MBV9296474.1 hypothetical protein [Acidobacteriaceae bacterium]